MREMVAMAAIRELAAGAVAAEQTQQAEEVAEMADEVKSWYIPGQHNIIGGELWKRKKFTDMLSLTKTEMF
jgi:hypothetical protein